MKTVARISVIVGALILAVALVGTCSLAADLPPFIGVNYGPYHKPGQSPDLQSSIPDSQFLADLGIITPKFKYIRTYGVEKAGRLDYLVPLIATHFPSLQVYLGVYESSKYRNETVTQMNKAIALANAYPANVKCVVVGNECLDRDFAFGAVTIGQLIADLQYVRSKITNPNILVTTCLGFLSALNPPTLPDGSANPNYQAGKDYGKAVMPYCDLMMFTVYPFFGKVAIDGALSNTQYWYKYAVNLFPGKQVSLGEAGWPSGVLPANGPAIPSVDNEKKYITDLITNQQDPQNRLGPIFLFEAFDEPWKKGNQWETHWGLWDLNGILKFDFTIPAFPTAGTPPIEAAIDINSHMPDYVFPKDSGLVRVVVHSSSNFDAGTLDLDTVRFGELGIEALVLRAALINSGNNRKEDLLLYFRAPETGIQQGDEFAYLTGLTKDGRSVVGYDTVGGGGR